MEEEYEVVGFGSNKSTLETLLVNRDALENSPLIDKLDEVIEAELTLALLEVKKLIVRTAGLKVVK